MEYRYTSTEERVYVDRALTVNSGDVVDWPDGAPEDGHWEPVDLAGNPDLEVLRTAPADGPDALKAAADDAKAAESPESASRPAKAAAKTTKE